MLRRKARSGGSRGWKLVYCSIVVCQMPGHWKSNSKRVNEAITSELVMEATIHNSTAESIKLPSPRQAPRPSTSDNAAELQPAGSGRHLHSSCHEEAGESHCLSDTREHIHKHLRPQRQRQMNAKRMRRIATNRRRRCYFRSTIALALT